MHDTELGCIIANNRSNSAVVEVRSNEDRWENNGVGCVIAGDNTLATGLTNSNSTTFEALGTKFVDNTGPALFAKGGITAYGVDNRATNTASNNNVQIRLWGCTFSGNQYPNFEAFGARNTVYQSQSDISGTNDKVTIELHDLSERVDIRLRTIR